MKTLEVAGLFANWGQHSIAGHGEGSPITFSLDAPCWVGVVGRNGTGKSTFLHALAGTAANASGLLKVNGQKLSLDDARSRFGAGVLHVPQSASLPYQHEAVDLPDAKDLAFAFRPGLENNVAGAALHKQLAEAGWFVPPLSPRLPELVASILSIPNLLLLDEITTIWSGKMDAVSMYRQIKELLPASTIIFVEHDINLVLEVADKVLWLRGDKQPLFADVRADHASIAEIRDEHRRALSQGKDVSFSQVAKRIVNLGEPVSSQLQLALRTLPLSKGERNALYASLCEDFSFFSRTEPADQLSGGMRNLLALILAAATTDVVLPSDLWAHIDGVNAALMRSWIQRLKESRRR